MIKYDDDELILKIKDGELYHINASDIESIEFIKERSIGIEGVRAIPFGTRYYYTQSAIPQGKGNHYSLIHLYGPEFHLGLTNRLSLGFMSTWIASPVGMSAKYTIPTKHKKVNFSIHSSMFSIGYLYQGRSWAGLHTATLTFGDRSRSISISSGLGLAKLDFGTKTGVIFNQSGNTYNTDLRQSSVSSIAGIYPIGNGWSFVFDAMVSVSKRRNYFTVFWFKDISGVDALGPRVSRKGTEIVAFIMPGLRFQKVEKRAFQFTMAGIAQHSTIGFTYNNYNNPKLTRLLPVPMCSWYLRF